MSTSLKALASLARIAEESAARMGQKAGAAPNDRGWNEDVLSELRRIRKAVERIADAADSTPLWRLAGLAADPGGEIDVHMTHTLKDAPAAGYHWERDYDTGERRLCKDDAERLEELTRRCKEAPRD